AEHTGANRIVIPVEPEVITRKSPPWLGELAAYEVLLVRPGPMGSEGPAWPRRILIPVLREFHQAPFDVAAAFSASEVVPEVDVVAARVIEMPPIVPMYSTYRPEALVDTTKELSFLDALRNRSLFRALTANVLLVRDIGRDVVDFATERDVDVIVIPAFRGYGRHDFLTKEKREIVQRARCTVVVVVEPASSHA
ncbi:MAG TPA: hypothetical protein VJP06_05425, partial [Thermoplasmata archaeon]|nr:hypothetical protein [Thermoplasmata archaeon]